MCRHRRCVLSHPLGAAAFVVGAGIAADVVLPLTGHATASTHAGLHPMSALAGLVVLACHFNSHRLAVAWRRLRSAP